MESSTKSFANFTVIRDERGEGYGSSQRPRPSSMATVRVSAIRVSHASTLQYVLRISRIEDAIFRLVSRPASASDETDQAISPILKAPVRTPLQIFKRRQIRGVGSLSAIDLTQSVPGHTPTRRNDGMAHPGPFHRFRQVLADDFCALRGNCRAADIPRDHFSVRPNDSQRTRDEERREKNRNRYSPLHQCPTLGKSVKKVRN